MFDYCPETAFVVVMTKTEPKKTIREFVYQRVRAGNCIYHEGVVKSATQGNWCNKKATKMGVCDQHYGAYRSQIHNQPEEVVARIESGLFGEGLLLRRQLVRQIKRTNAITMVARAARGRAS